MKKRKDLYKKYLEEGEKLLEAGYYVQASEKFWGAAAEIVKAVAAKRGEHLSAHNKIREFVKDLHKQNPTLNLYFKFLAAEELHRNFYENNLTLEDIEIDVEGVKEFIKKMEKFLND